MLHLLTNINICCLIYYYDFFLYSLTNRQRVTVKVTAVTDVLIAVQNLLLRTFSVNERKDCVTIKKRNNTKFSITDEYSVYENFFALSRTLMNTFSTYANSRKGWIWLAGWLLLVGRLVGWWEDTTSSSSSSSSPSSILLNRTPSQLPHKTLWDVWVLFFILRPTPLPHYKTKGVTAPLIAAAAATNVAAAYDKKR